MINPGIQFPAIAFSAKDNDFGSFKTEKLWHEGGDAAFDFDEGTIVVDASGKAWDAHERQVDWSEIKSKVRTFIGKLMKVEPDPEISFTARDPMPWNEVIDRTCASIDALPDTWRNDELAAGETGEPVGDAEQMAILKSQVRQADSMERLVTLLLWTDWDDRPALVASWSEP